MVAKEILRRKCFVGLLDKMDESIVRFHAYFKFGDDAALDCARRNFASAGGQSSNSNIHSHSTLDPNGETWKILENKNALDIKLYEYTQQLFEEQGKWMKKHKLL